ncbi:MULTISPECIES: ribosomal-processing cysteine protease Prp [Brevibacillus]|uniref:Ribosomal processing cysteine protease Prp n=1 Tax=Brevibacillus invocatus TaxID=173959 RepID=A0A3M8CMJ3_9BACL|nr:MULTISPECIES: ribosomal-processing cysteine protease Prp [Brevibacillus]MCM3080125.1 ribosomal-processing cysteine protease Prp [Brevibacillus invocatus]MCM3430318.1 ribosomal-processing cysteine protease Prp [Brevibacillus invocatus]MDH4615498.1 ribosomal-processing cysteine protease Prp [Brevibacillus sp. AY1]RNB76982.1 ribosomal-processing cysteine protease Prp [Brevibacillus invocatus]
MVTVNVKRNEQNGIEEITISGHANAGKHGSDIVCAAVSAISLGLINSVDLLLGSNPDVQFADKEGGFINWKVGCHQDPLVSEKQQLLAESMVVSLFMIAETNGRYVSIQDPKWQGGV